MPAIRQAADWFAASILAGRMVHVLGRAKPDHGGGDVAAVWIVSGVQSDRRVVADVS